MNRTTKIILASIIVAVLVAAGIAVKLIYFPSVKEIWFRGNGHQLRLVPNGLVVVRPTRFPSSLLNSISGNEVKNEYRMAGRNVTFQTLIAVAYDHNAGRIYLPPDAPTNNFDFILAAPRDRLKSAILKRTGFSAHIAQQETDVLALKVEYPNSPGLVASAPNEKSGSNYKNGRLYLSRIKIQELADGLEWMLKTPVINKTGLTNYYDLSLVWKRGTRTPDLNRDQAQKIVQEWGLNLEPDTQTIEMLVVKKGR